MKNLIEEQINVRTWKYNRDTTTKQDDTGLWTILHHITLNHQCRAYSPKGDEGFATKKWTHLMRMGPLWCRCDTKDCIFVTFSVWNTNQPSLDHFWFAIEHSPDKIDWLSVTKRFYRDKQILFKNVPHFDFFVVWRIPQKCDRRPLLATLPWDAKNPNQTQGNIHCNTWVMKIHTRVRKMLSYGMVPCHSGAEKMNCFTRHPKHAIQIWSWR